jgi:L-lactate utilization protein LutC
MALSEWLTTRGAKVVAPLKEFASSGEAGLGWKATDRAADGRALIEAYKRALMSADIGLTTADYAIADTGTLVLVSGSEQHRLVSLVPPVHVCLIDSGRIVARLPDLLARAAERFRSAIPPQAMTFITGPSRTADIELSLTLGVHGPRELHVLLYQPSGFAPGHESAV